MLIKPFLCFQELGYERNKKYEELKKRIEREKQLSIISQKLEMKKHLLDNKAKKKKISEETTEASAVYKWVPQRKRWGRLSIDLNFYM